MINTVYYVFLVVGGLVVLSLVLLHCKKIAEGAEMKEYLHTLMVVFLLAVFSPLLGVISIKTAVVFAAYAAFTSLAIMGFYLRSRRLTAKKE